MQLGHTPNPAPSDWSWFKHLHCLASRILLLWQEMDFSFELKIDISMNLHFRKVRKKSLQQNLGHLPLVWYCTNQKSECLNAFLSSPTDCTWTYSSQHPDKLALPGNPNTLLRLTPKQPPKKCDHVQSAPNFTAQGLHSQQEQFEKNKSRKWNLEWKINNIKNDHQLSSLKICGFSYNLRNGKVGSFLSIYFLFEVFIFKNVLNIADNISRSKNGHLKRKVPWPSVATLGFKSLIL
jgi:hypothetical protein